MNYPAYIEKYMILVEQYFSSNFFMCSSWRDAIRHPSPKRSLNLDTALVQAGNLKLDLKGKWVANESSFGNNIYALSKYENHKTTTTVGYIIMLEFRALTGSWGSFTLVYVCKRKFIINVKL